MAEMGAGFLVRVSLSEYEGIDILTVRGELDYGNCLEFRREVLPVIEGRSGPVILDLSDTAYVDSSGLGMCSWILKQLLAQQRYLVVVSNPTVDNIMFLTRLNHFFDLVECQEQALALQLKRMGEPDGQ